MHIQKIVVSTSAEAVASFLSLIPQTSNVLTPMLLAYLNCYGRSCSGVQVALWDESIFTLMILR
jgi:hypothetical protein